MSNTETVDTKMKVSLKQAASMTEKYIKARLPPFIKSSPGKGKSSIVKWLARKHKLKLIDLRLSQCDPTDLLGFPNIMGKKAGYVPMNTFPLEGDPIPEGYNGWLLFLDEFNSAAKATEAAAYKLVLDRMVGQDNLHKNVAIVLAGNLATDNAIVNDLSTAMQSRVAHIILDESDIKEWTDYAAEQGWDHRLSDYVRWKPGMLNTFTADHSDETYACPRTWEFADRVLKVTDEDDPDREPMLAGVISEGPARELLQFFAVYSTLPKIEQIIADPLNTPIPDEPGTQWALTGQLSHNTTMENLDKLAIYIYRLPTEFQVVTLREIVRRNKAMMRHPVIQKWIASSANDLYE